MMLLSRIAFRATVAVTLSLSIWCWNDGLNAGQAAVTHPLNGRGTWVGMHQAHVSLGGRPAGDDSRPGMDTTPTPTPTSSPGTPTPPVSTQFSLVSVRVENFGALPDWHQVLPPLRQVKVGTQVQLAIYFVVFAGPAGEPYTVHWKVTRGALTLLDQDFSKDHLSDTKPADTYWDAVGPLTLAAKGTYHVTGTLTIDGRSASGSTSISAKAKISPPPPPVSFSFDKLVVTDAKKHQIKTLAAGSGLNVMATYTVHNIPSGHVVSGVIAHSYEIKLPGHGYQKLTGNSDSITVNNGKHTSTSHISRWDQAGALRILVGITIGGTFEERHYDMVVTGT